MTIPERLMKKWEALRTPGDANRMIEKMGSGYPELFNRAMRDGKCNDEVFKVMAEFYEEKAQVVKEYL